MFAAPPLSSPPNDVLSGADILSYHTLPFSADLPPSSVRRLSPLPPLESPHSSESDPVVSSFTVVRAAIGSHYLADFDLFSFEDFIFAVIFSKYLLGDQFLDISTLNKASSSASTSVSFYTFTSTLVQQSITLTGIDFDDYLRY